MSGTVSVLMIAPNPPTVVTVSTIRLSAAIVLMVVRSALFCGVRMLRDTQSRKRNPVAPNNPSLAVPFSFSFGKAALRSRTAQERNGGIGFS